MTNRSLALGALAACVFNLAACDKLRGAKSDGDGGETASSGGGAGLLGKALSLVTPGAAFEGAITMSETSGDRPARTMDYEVKGDKMRFDGMEKDGYVIFNQPDRKIIIVNDTKKTGMVMSLDEMQNPGGPMGAPHAPPTAKPESEWDSQVDMNAGTDVVAGYSCDKWKITTTNKKTAKIRKTDACLAKGIGFPSMGGDKSGVGDWRSKLVADKYFPLRMVETEDGKVTSKMEVTKIDKKPLDAARFEVPAGYKTIDMAEMMKALQSGDPSALKKMQGM